MSWLAFHKDSESLAAAAHETRRNGDIKGASDLFRRAAEFEARALENIDSSRPRTLGVTAVSAVALWYKAGDLEQAARLAHQASAIIGMPAFAIGELRRLLQAIWNEDAQRQAGVSFTRGQFIVSVKGGDVVEGGAPLDLVLDKVQLIQSFIFRTAEFVQNFPLRKKGPPSKEIQEQCRPWLFQSVPGSYQFSVAVQKPRQTELFSTEVPEPKALTDTFLAILRAAGEDPAARLSDVVPKDDYRTTFLKMTRNLAPTGKSFSSLEIRAADDREAVILTPNSRKNIAETLRTAEIGGSPDTRDNETMLRGILRALDLDHDWLEISVQGTHKRIRGVGETVDDLIGPMVNREVVVRVRPGRGNSLIFIDIEQDE